MYILNSPLWLNTVTGDETGPTSQFFSLLHYPPSSWKAVPHHPGLRPLLFTNSMQHELFYVPQESDQRKSCETGPTVLSEKTRMSNLCRCHNKGSTLSSVILRPWVLVRPGIEPATSRSADQRLSNWANRATQSQKLIVFISLLVLFLFLKSTSFFTCRKLIFVVSFLLRTFSRKKVTRHESFT